LLDLKVTWEAALEAYKKQITENKQTVAKFTASVGDMPVVQGTSPDMGSIPWQAGVHLT
jgi:hypothetical protein